MSERFIKDVYKFVNGNVMVFDQWGQQMPEFQGNDWKEKLQSLDEADLQRATFHGCYDWRTGHKISG